MSITQLANDILEFCKAHEMIDTSIYFNNKRISYTSCGVVVEENVNPLDYFEYAATKHILSMSFEGELYSLLNYSGGLLLDQFDNIFKRYGLYYELGNAWNLTAYPIDGDYEDIAYTDYTESIKQEVWIYRHKDDVPSELSNIMNTWYELSKTTGDKGCCVLGAGFKFEWQGTLYKMAACSPWQGNLSWESHIDYIRQMLIDIGAINIVYLWGNID